MIYLFYCRHAYNIQIHEVNQLVTKAILELSKHEDPEIGPAQFITKAKKVKSICVEGFVLILII